MHPPRSLPASLNGFRIWVLLVLALTVANYGYPLAQFLFLQDTGVPAYPGAGAMSNGLRALR